MAGEADSPIYETSTQSMEFAGHIFPKAKVTSNKNAHNFQHYFWAQFLMLFHLAWSILFGVLAWETTFSLVEIKGF